MTDTLEVELPREILVKNKKVKTIETRLPTVGDELNASKMARFTSELGHTEVDDGLQKIHIISAVSNIPVSDLKSLKRQEYAFIADAVGKLEMSVLLEEVQENTLN